MSLFQDSKMTDNLNTSYPEKQKKRPGNLHSNISIIYYYVEVDKAKHIALFNQKKKHIALLICVVEKRKEEVGSGEW